jgi:hypothetical protein
MARDLFKLNFEITTAGIVNGCKTISSYEESKSETRIENFLSLLECQHKLSNVGMFGFRTKFFSNTKTGPYEVFHNKFWELDLKMTGMKCNPEFSYKESESGGNTSESGAGFRLTCEYLGGIVFSAAFYSNNKISPEGEEDKEFSMFKIEATGKECNPKFSYDELNSGKNSKKRNAGFGVTCKYPNITLDAMVSSSKETGPGGEKNPIKVEFNIKGNF